MKISALVVLYNVKVSESNTIKSLIEIDAFSYFEQVVIWNNGPNYLSSDCIDYIEGLRKNITLNETIENRALSRIYNDFISKSKSDRYILLDHDSYLTKEYLYGVIASNNNNDLLIPTLKCNDKIVSPRVECLFFPQFQSNEIVAVGSGLVISKSLVRKFSNHKLNVFDERFFLYGVDTTLFYRLRRLNKKSCIDIKIIEGFEHDISTYKVEDKHTKNFRIIEGSYSLGLKLRYYPNRYVLYAFIRMLLGQILKRDPNSHLPSIIKAFFSGKHYREECKHGY